MPTASLSVYLMFCMALAYIGCHLFSTLRSLQTDNEDLRDRLELCEDVLENLLEDLEAAGILQRGCDHGKTLGDIAHLDGEEDE